MRLVDFAIAAALPAIAAAHDVAARQAASSSGASTHKASTATGSSAPTTSAASTAATTYSFSLSSSNPTAVPLSSINSAAPSAATRSLATTPVAGSTPSSLPSAPALPDVSAIKPSNYPALDVLPPLDSPEVLQWIEDVKNSGVTIPDIAPTVAGGCSANLAAAADTSRCWWTCTGCTRDTDITTCPDKMSWGLTYDDGPSLYTPDLLDYLDQENLKSTFFIVGSRAISYPPILQAEYMEGHQIAVHTWAHPALTTLTNEGIIAELGWTKKIIKDVLGVTPNMMRPPFGDIDDRVRAISTAMGLTPVMWTRISATATFDTDDFNIHGGLASVQQVLQNWDYIRNNATQMDNGFILLEHDLFQQAVEVATGYILPDALSQKDPSFDIKPVVQCLNKPLSDAYIELNDNSTNPPAQSGVAVTLSSGAAGSAQATGAAADANSSAASPSMKVGFATAVSAVFAGIAIHFL